MNELELERMDKEGWLLIIDPFVYNKFMGFVIVTTRTIELFHKIHFLVELSIPSIPTHVYP